MGVRVQHHARLLADVCPELRRESVYYNVRKQGNALSGVPALWPECRSSLIGREGDVRLGLIIR